MDNFEIQFLPYKLFFLYIEPISALLGAFYAGKPAEYLSMLKVGGTALHHTNLPIPTPVAISLFQLSNLYLLFALNEHLVLSSTDSLRTWRRLLTCLLIADFGHLITMFPLGPEIYWRVWDWNAMAWGSVAFVYIGAAMRMSFLFGLGVKRRSIDKAGTAKSR